MSILNNITTKFNLNVSSDTTSILSQTGLKYAKITLVALAIIGSAIVAYLAYKRFAGFKATPPKPNNQASTTPTVPVNQNQHLHPHVGPLHFIPKPPNLPHEHPNQLPSTDQSTLQPQISGGQWTHQPPSIDKPNEQDSFVQPSDETLTSPNAQSAATLATQNKPSEAAPVSAHDQVKIKVPKAPFLAEVEAILTEVSLNVTNPSFSTTKAFSKISRQTQGQVLGLLDEVIHEFERRYPSLQRISYGDVVPAYFANVIGESTESRKYLSLVGMRNLLMYGPKIIEDFTRQNFIGGLHHYSYNAGLNAFKLYTGNIVDLDIELPNPSTFVSISPGTALAQAKELIIAFGKKCGLKGRGGDLTAEEVANQLPNRNLHLPGPHEQIHYAMSNDDRSNAGIWSRHDPETNCLKYFVNVPNYDVVLGATLRLPYIIAELIWRAKASNGGTLNKDFLDDFFTRGVSDKCFNNKFAQFIDFSFEWMAKFDPEETPEEIVKSKVESGAFGETLKAQGTDAALRDALSRFQLINLVDEELDIKKNGRDVAQFVAEETDKVIEFLESKGYWEKRLYQSEGKTEKNPKGSHYILLNRAAMTQFLTAYYNYLF